MGSGTARRFYFGARNQLRLARRHGENGAWRVLIVRRGFESRARLPGQAGPRSRRGWPRWRVERAIIQRAGSARIPARKSRSRLAISGPLLPR
jgi:hypothetical protein